MHRILSAVALAALVGACNSTPDGGLDDPDQEIFEGEPNTYSWEPLVPADGAMVLVDQATGTRFNLRGEAFDGPLADEKLLLRQVDSVNMFWFAWSIYLPGSEVHGRSQTVRAATLPADKVGNIACGGGKDCIPSLPNAGEPQGALAWSSPGATDMSYLNDDDLVVGVFQKGVARAYPHNLLWWHEIANDTIGDSLKFSVTFCPLTGSALVWDGTDNGLSFGVSGNLFNSNLVMYDHQTESLWPQLWMGAVSGPSEDGSTWLPRLPHQEMTWRSWRELHPDTLVLSGDTGYGANYTQYPYGNYRNEDDNTFAVTDPAPDSMFPGKTQTFGLVDKNAGIARAYVEDVLVEELGAKGVILDEFGGEPVVLVWDQAARSLLVFSRNTSAGVLDLVLEEPAG